MTPPNQRELEEVYIPEEDRLFDSDSDSSESTESASRLNDISNQVTAEEVQVNSFPSISSRLTRNQLQEFGDILQRLRGLTTGLERATSRLQPFILRLSEGGAQQSGLAELRDQARSMEALLMNQARWITDVVSQRNPQEQRMQVDSRLHEFEFGVQRESRARQFEPDRDSLRQHYARVFGTVEDVQRSDYESPISRMFDRQWERLRAAREMTGEMLTRPGPDHSTSNQPLSRPNEVLIATTSQITDQQGRLDDSMPTADAIFTNMQNVVNSMRTSRQDPNNKNRARLIDSLLPPPENSLTEEQMHIKLQCTICLEQVADIALVPCGHLVMCRWCSERHSRIDTYANLEQRRLANLCPLCRGPIKHRLRIYGWDGQQREKATISDLPSAADSTGINVPTWNFSSVSRNNAGTTQQYEDSEG